MSHFPNFQTAINLLSSSNNSIKNSKYIDNIQDAAHLTIISPSSFTYISQINLYDKYIFPDLHDVLHGKLRDLQEHDFGETLGSVAINSQQIHQILHHPKITTDNPEGLLYHVFFRLSIILAMREGEHYQLKISQFKSNENGGLKFFRYISKNNQRGIQGRQAYIILILANDNGPCSDIQLYLSKRPPSAKDTDENFYLQPNNTSWLETNIWYKTDHIGKNKLGNFMKKIGRETQIDIPIELLSNHSEHKTATQILQDQEVPEQAIMQLTGHKSVQGVRAYKKVNENQQLNTLNTLINITDNKSSTFIQKNSQNNLINNDNSNSQLPLQEISLSLNSLNSLNELPIFHNCTFSNVTFNIQK
ncbi:zinc finger MYM-type protein 2-like [Rhizophagus clarus]|uniref:Zinc finger MYM-type protein 2-like n=1 Tax=Rhizophagus clarus TaxID=94130 RepID=A0A8H3QWF8_9GLOM|nr:zinc finger MYM-type protein 2-like [Rhizophagus clarus]